MSTISVVHVDILIFIDFVFIKTPVNSTLKRKMVTMMLEDLDAVNMMECLQDPCKNPKIEGGYSIHMDPPARYQISEEGSPVDVVATRNGSLHIKIGNARCEIIDALEAEVKKVVHDKFPGRRLRSCLGPDGCLKLRAPVGNTCYKTAQCFLPTPTRSTKQRARLTCREARTHLKSSSIQCLTGIASLC